MGRRRDDKVGKGKVDNKQRLLIEDKSKVGSKKLTLTEKKSIMEKVKVEVNEEIRKNCTKVKKEMRVVKREVVRIRRDKKMWIEKLENLRRSWRRL